MLSSFEIAIFLQDTSTLTPSLSVRQHEEVIQKFKEGNINRTNKTSKVCNSNCINSSPINTQDRVRNKLF